MVLNLEIVIQNKLEQQQKDKTVVTHRNVG